METSLRELKESVFTTIRRDGCPDRALASWNGCWSGIYSSGVLTYILEGNRLCVRERNRKTWYTLS
jgi:hypothetical protein